MTDGVLLREALQRLDYGSVMAALSLDLASDRAAIEAGVRRLMALAVEDGRLDRAEDAAFVIGRNRALARSAGGWFEAARESLRDRMGPLAEEALDLRSACAGALLAIAERGADAAPPPAAEWVRAFEILAGEELPRFAIRVSMIGTRTRYGGRVDCAVCHGAGVASGKDCACAAFLEVAEGARSGHVVRFVDRTGAHVQWGRIGKVAGGRSEGRDGA